jgi:hypothetical protein
MGPDEEAFTAMQRGGQVRDHLGTHDVTEWAQELIDLRPVPVEVAPLLVAEPIRRRTPAASLTYLADRLAESGADNSTTKAGELVRAVEIALRTLALEANDG